MARAKAEAVVLTTRQRRALTTWVLSNSQRVPDMSWRQEPPLGRQVMVYDGIDIHVEDSFRREEDRAELRDYLGRYVKVTYGPVVLIERGEHGVPASVFEDL